jgi:hypothetical protein
MSDSRTYRVFCPRCGDHFNVTELRDTLHKTIDRVCRACGKPGVDAVDLDRQTAEV